MKDINIYSTKNINLITLIISLVIFLSLNFLISKFNSNNLIENSIDNNISNNKIQKNNNQKEEEQVYFKENNENNPQEFNWYIEISSIDLKAPIKESTKMEVLNEFVGHFEDMSKTIGNIGLAGHNRGYKNNYFENLNKVKKGDEIKYKYYDFEKFYSVENIEIIKSTNWKYLENSKNNKITLITCIENAPDYRLCIQGEEKQ